MSDKKEFPVVIRFEMNKNEEKSKGARTNYATSLKVLKDIPATAEMQNQLAHFLADHIVELEDVLQSSCAMTISNVQIDIKPFLL